MRARGAEPAPVWRGAPPRDSLRSPAIAAPPVVGALTLERAIGLALRFHSALAESSWLVRSTAARAREESRWANPTLEGLAENFGGSVGSGHTETTVSLSQPIDVTGARRARVDVATGLERLAEMDLSSREREVVAATEASYLDVWWIEQRLVHVGRSAAIARTLVAAARERTRAGAAPPVEGLRAETVVAQREIERRGLEADLAEARRRLALGWGATTAEFDTLALPLPTVPALPTSAELIADLEKNPERMRAAIETSVALARVHEARASRFPEISVLGGVRWFEDIHGTGFLAGVSLPFPLWNRHGDLIHAAEAEHQAALARERAVRLGLQLELASAYDHLMSSHDRFEEARTRLAPAAREALVQLQRGYHSGRFSYLDQLEAQRAAVEAELTMLETERDAWIARLTLERLLGRTLEEIAEGRR
jgi:cobalt-zinc-cadmium efflux system outer membrane protein